MRGLAHDLVHAQARVEAGVGILEDHLDFQAGLARLGRRHVGGAQAVDADLAAGRREQAGRDAAQRGLAAAGFADQADHFAGAHDQVHAVHGAGHGGRPGQAGALQQAGGAHGAFAEALADVAQLDQGRGVALRCRGVPRVARRLGRGVAPRFVRVAFGAAHVATSRIWMVG